VGGDGAAKGEGRTVRRKTAGDLEGQSERSKHTLGGAVSFKRRKQKLDHSGLLVEGKGR